MYQRTIVIGHLGADPEMRYTPTGVPVTSFRIATTRRWTNPNGEQQEKTTWFRVTAWRKLAETCNQYLTKGQLVLVDGDIDSSAWIGQDGQARSSLDLTARTVRFLGRRGEREAPVGAGEPLAEEGVGSEEEIPF